MLYNYYFESVNVQCMNLHYYLTKFMVVICSLNVDHPNYKNGNLK